jgi:aspartate-semialdehyde dehydrogenase
MTAPRRLPDAGRPSGHDDVLVGRIRKDPSDPSGESIAMFVAHTGPPLTAVQISEFPPERERETA